MLGLVEKSRVPSGESARPTGAWPTGTRPAMQISQQLLGLLIQIHVRDAPRLFGTEIIQQRIDRSAHGRSLEWPPAARQ